MNVETPNSNRISIIIRSILKDFFEGHILRNISEVRKACTRLFEENGLDPIARRELDNLIYQESMNFFKRDPHEVVERSYKERTRPRNQFEASRAHYTAAEKNFAQKILKVLEEKTSINLLKQENLDRIVPIFNELYPKIFGNEHYRTYKAVSALLRREQKRRNYGFIRPHKSICEDDLRDTKKLKNLRKLVLRRIKSVETEEPFLL